MIKTNKKLSFIIIALVSIFVIAAIINFLYQKQSNDFKFEKINYVYNFVNSKEGFTEDCYDTGEYVTTFEIDNDYYYEDEGSLHIINHSENDSRYILSTKLKKGHYYLVSAWVSTRNVGEDNIGANISFMGNFYNKYYGDLRGDNDWTEISGVFYAARDMEVDIAFRLGGYSNDNTGEVWFDNIRLESFETIPFGFSKSDVYTLGATNTNQQKIREMQYNNVYILGALTISVILWLIYLSLYNSKEEPYAKGMYFLFVIVAAGLMLRILIAPIASGFDNDIACFKSWGLTMSKDVFNFYDNVSFCDYPPFYIYIIGAFSKLATIFGIEAQSEVFTLIIKMPPIIADILSSLIIYKLLENKLTDNWRLFFASVYLFNPMVLLDSVVWGQIDSVWALLVLLAVYAITRRRYILSSFLYGLAIMVKPQGLFTGPVLVFALLATMNAKNIKQVILKMFQCGVTVIGTIVLTSLPYLIKYGPTWILKLFFSTAGQYAYASVNCFNLYAIFELNWVKDSETFLTISYFIWGIAFLVLSVIVSGILYLKMHKKYSTLPYFSALMLSVWIVVFTVRMHERYMFPAIIFSLIVAIYDNSKPMFKIHGLITLTTFFNSLVILGRKNSGGSIADFSSVNYDNIIGIINVAIAIFIGIYAYRILKNKKNDVLVPNTGLLTYLQSVKNDAQDLNEANEGGDINEQ